MRKSNSARAGSAPGSDLAPRAVVHPARPGRASATGRAAHDPRLTDAGANRTERAILLERNGPVAQFVHDRLERAGVLKPAANHRYYWDEIAYRELIRGRRRRAMIVVAILAVLIVMIYLL